MPVVPFIPLIVSGVSAVAGHYAAKKAQAAALKRSPEEAAALTGAQGVAGELKTRGTGQLDLGAATEKPATSYFDTLLHGNRAAQSQAVAAPTAGVQDVYRGAERNLEQQGVRGAQKQVASAELGRGRASQISSLITGVQPGAAQQLTSIGQVQGNRGAAMLPPSGSLYANLLGQGNANRQYARGEGEKAGTGIGGLLFDVAQGAASSAQNKWGGSKFTPQSNYNYSGGG